MQVLQRNRDLAGTFMNVRRFGMASNDDADGDHAMASVLARAQGTYREHDVMAFGPELFPALLQSVPLAFQRVVVRGHALEANATPWRYEWIRDELRRRRGWK